MHYMCILCTIKASKLGDRIMIESFLAVISYWTTGHMFSIIQWGDLHDQKSTITMLGAMCVRVNISTASVYDVKRQIK